MERPKTRRKYDTFNIAQSVYQHFIIDKSPKCESIDNGPCIYNGTGCAVGCMLTEEDANLLENNGGGTLGDVWDRHPEILSQYFSVSDYTFLKELQDAHDDNPKEDIVEGITKVLFENGFSPEDFKEVYE